ncbi:MAG: VOC family protein [Nitrospirae bacterium]|nr:VOC family protein [Nitrospirota bacterium]
MTKKTEPLLSLRGLRHLALRVTDMARARNFYQGLLGMTVVWEPDPENVYLTSGWDNLALHLMPKEEAAVFDASKGQSMDHLGFIVESSGMVEGYERRMREAGVRIVKPFKRHRDGSSSFYMADPDGNVIQILYEPQISPLNLRAGSEAKKTAS